jgi:OmpA-OmpF porin, OOP family
MTKRIVLFTLSLIVAGFAHAQSQQAIRDQLFGPTDALKKEADAVHAKLLGPTAYAEAMELYKEAGDTLEKGKDVNSVKEDLSKADGLLKKSTDAAKLAQVTFAEPLSARAAAEKAEAAKYAAKDWGKAEDELKDAAEQLEDGNLNKASKTAAEASKAYKTTESKAINAKAKATH